MIFHAFTNDLICFNQQEAESKGNTTANHSDRYSLNVNIVDLKKAFRLIFKNAAKTMIYKKIIHP